MPLPSVTQHCAGDFELRAFGEPPQRQREGFLIVPSFYLKTGPSGKLTCSQQSVPHNPYQPEAEVNATHS